MKLNTKALALTGGILWGVALMLMTWVAMSSGYAQEFLELIMVAYPGYSLSFTGSLIGLALGFVDAFVGLYIFALIYNWLVGKMSKQEQREL